MSKKKFHLLGIKKSIIYQSLTHFCHHSVPYNTHTHHFGHCRVLSPEDLKLIVALVKQRHYIYLDKLPAEVFNIHGVTLSQSSLLCTLYHLQYSHKHVSTCALERELVKVQLKKQSGFEY
jgi:hypothetical protein